MDVHIPITELHFGELLGKGAFGAVYKGTWKDQEIAIKKVFNMADYDTDRYFTREVEILGSIKHPYIVKFLGTSKDGADLCLVTEFIKGRNLRDYLRNVNSDWVERIKFATQIAISLEYLHKTRIIHRDVKTENILVEETTHSCKLCDFGFSRSSTTETKRMTFVGSEWFEAPEIMFCIDYDERIDIFSYGMVLCEILSRQSPSMTVFKRVIPGFGLDPEEITSRAEPGAPTPLIHIAIACCEDDPNKRPELSHVIETLKALYLDMAKKPFTPPKTTLPVPRKSIKIVGKTRQKLGDSKPLPNENLTTKIEGDTVLPKLNITLNDPRIVPIDPNLSLTSPLATTPSPVASPTISPSKPRPQPTPTAPASSFLPNPTPANANHTLNLVKFSTPTYCHECKFFIWGLSRTGYHCKACGINVHKKCQGTSLPCNPPKSE